MWWRPSHFLPTQSTQLSCCSLSLWKQWQVCVSSCIINSFNTRQFFHNYLLVFSTSNFLWRCEFENLVFTCFYFSSALLLHKKIICSLDRHTIKYFANVLVKATLDIFFTHRQDKEERKMGEKNMMLFFNQLYNYLRGCKIKVNGYSRL